MKSMRVNFRNFHTVCVGNFSAFHQAKVSIFSYLNF